MDDKQTLESQGAEALSAQAQDLAGQQDQQKKPQVDEQGRRLFDEQGQPIHWATPRERVTAFILALVVIAITLAFAWSIYTGALFRR